MSAMTAVALAQASEAPSHRMDSKLGDKAKSLAMEMPTMQETSWPPMALRGWERGDSMA